MAHCQAGSIRVAPGQAVERGEPIAGVGRTCGDRHDPACRFGSGNTHLHLEFVRRWPLRGADVEARYDVLATLRRMGWQLDGSGRIVSGDSPDTPRDPDRSPPAGAVELSDPPQVDGVDATDLLLGAAVLWWVHRRMR